MVNTRIINFISASYNTDINPLSILRNEGIDAPVWLGTDGIDSLGERYCHGFDQPCVSCGYWSDDSLYLTVPFESLIKTPPYFTGEESLAIEFCDGSVETWTITPFILTSWSEVFLYAYKNGKKIQNLWLREDAIDGDVYLIYGSVKVKDETR